MKRLLKTAYPFTVCSLYCVCILAWALSTGSVFASDWKGGVEGGTVVSSSGNQTRLRLTLTNNVRPFTHHLFAEWLRGDSGQDGYSVGYNPRYWLDERFYLFGESRLRTDESFAIDRELLLLAGFGGQLLDSESQGLYAELGLGSRVIEFDSEEETTQGLGIARAGYYRVLAELVKFEGELSGVQSEDDIREINGEIGLSLRIPSGAIKYSYRSRSIKVGDNEAVSDDDSFVSFTYGF